MNGKLITCGLHKSTVPACNFYLLCVSCSVIVLFTHCLWVEILHNHHMWVLKWENYIYWITILPHPKDTGRASLDETMNSTIWDIPDTFYYQHFYQHQNHYQLLADGIFFLHTSSSGLSEHPPIFSIWKLRHYPLKLLDFPINTCMILHLTVGQWCHRRDCVKSTSAFGQRQI